MMAREKCYGLFYKSVNYSKIILWDWAQEEKNKERDEGEEMSLKWNEFVELKRKKILFYL